jgi:hypothetical protein
MALLTAVEVYDPLFYQKAMALDQAEDWQHIYTYEIDMLAKNSTWVLMDLPPG